MTYSNILSINAVYIFQRDPNLNSRFHNTNIKVKAQTLIRSRYKISQKTRTKFYMSFYTFVLYDKHFRLALSTCGEHMLILQSYILFLNTITDLSKLSIIKPGVRVRGLPSRYETFERS